MWTRSANRRHRATCRLTRPAAFVIFNETAPACWAVPSLQLAAATTEVRMVPIDNINRRTLFGDRVMKVNHAGENGAIHIYTGQIFMAHIRAPALVAELREFKAHEEQHRSIFAAELTRRGMPRCRSYWLCGAGGLALGIVTGLFGGQAIAATTAAVERVVLEHLRQQLLTVNGSDDQAAAAISAIVDEEQQHFDRSTSHLRPADFWSRLLSPVVAAATESVIWLGMRL